MTTITKTIFQGRIHFERMDRQYASASAPWAHSLPEKRAIGFLMGLWRQSSRPVRRYRGRTNGTAKAGGNPPPRPVTGSLRQHRIRIPAFDVDPTDRWRYRRTFGYPVTPLHPRAYRFRTVPTTIVKISTAGAATGGPGAADARRNPPRKMGRQKTRRREKRSAHDGCSNHSTVPCHRLTKSISVSRRSQIGRCGG